jgi:hypothetical protein
MIPCIWMSGNPKDHLIDHDSFAPVYHNSSALMSFKLAQILTSVSDKLTLSACQTAITYILHWCDR